MGADLLLKKVEIFTSAIILGSVVAVVNLEMDYGRV
jgi:hypothetical protein